MSRYANFVKITDLNGLILWTNNSEAAALFKKKNNYVDRIMALRSLEQNLSGFEGTEEVLETIKAEYVKVNKKIIAANRKFEREGWFTISNDEYQRTCGVK